MKIKDYTCKCGNSDFFFADKGTQKGIYCSYCGKWLKWANKDEQNLAMKQELVIDKIRAEIEELDGYEDRFSMVYDRPSLVRRVRNDCLKIIDKYKAEGSDPK